MTKKIILEREILRTPETRMLIACSRTDIDETSEKLIVDLLKKPIDWDVFLIIASKNGLLPLAAWYLSKHFSEHLDDEIKGIFKEIVTNHAQHNLFQTLHLIRIVNAFKEANIPLLPIKGASLAIQAYGALGLRDFCDHDLVVQPRHFDKALEILVANGYVPANQADWATRKFSFLTRRKDTVLFDDSKEVMIELHWKLSGSYFSMPVQLDRLWNSLETHEISGTSMSRLKFDDLFAYLCLHGCRHRWEKFSWLVDLRELIRSEEAESGSIDWRRVRSHAKSLGCERVVDLSLILLERLFEMDVPHRELSSDSVREEFADLVSAVTETAFTPNPRPIRFDEKYKYYSFLKEKPSHRLKLHFEYSSWLARMLFKPNSLDESTFRLPKLLYPFYYVLRPFRLLSTRKRLSKNQ